MTDQSLTRRKLIQASIGAAGVALMAGGALTGGIVARGAGNATVTSSVYGSGDGECGSCLVCTTVAGLRSEPSPSGSALYWVNDKGHEGLFRYDAADTATVDNTGTVLVSTVSGARFKRIFEDAWDIKWFGAKGDGVANDTAAVQLAFDSASDYETIVFSEGVYRLSGINVDKKHLTVIGSRCSVKMISKTVNLFQLTEADSFSIRDFTVTTEYSGQIVDKYEGHVVYGSGDQIRISNMHITGSSIALHSSNHPIVENSRVVGSPNQVDYGITMYACAQFIIQNNEAGIFKVDAIKASTLNAFRSPTGEREAKEYGLITGNFLYDCPEDDGIDIYDGGRKIIVSYNTIYNCLRGINIKSQGVSIPESNYWAEHSLIIGNQINECVGFIQVGGSHYDISHNICKNEQRGTTTARGVTIGVDDLYPIVSNVRFTNNTIIGAAAYGVEVGNFASDITLAFNNIENSGSYAYYLHGDRITLVGGTLKDIYGDRFISVSPKNFGAVTISNVTMVNDQSTTPIYGIRVTAAATEVTVSGCVTKNIATPFRDDSTGKQVRHSGNSWNGKPSGVSGSRPAIPQAGQWYYDTTLGQPIVYTGSVWIDTTGATV
jgi:hypothetical protein